MKDDDQLYRTEVHEGGDGGARVDEPGGYFDDVGDEIEGGGEWVNMEGRTDEVDLFGQEKRRARQNLCSSILIINVKAVCRKRTRISRVLLGARRRRIRQFIQPVTSWVVSPPQMSVWAARAARTRRG